MSRGLPYDSDAGRDYAATITAVMHGAGVCPVGARRPRSRRAVPRLREEPRADAARHAQAPRGAQGHQPDARAEAALRGRQADLGRVHRARRAARLSQRAGDRARADRHDRLHDGLRHDRRRAGHRARQVQEARRRRVDEDRQQHRADGPREARLHARADQGHRRLHRRARDDRRRAAPQGQGPRGVRLRVQARAGRPLDPLHGPHQDDGRRAAVHLGRDLEDRQRPEGRDGRGNRAGLHRRVAHGREGRLDLSRRQQAHAAAQHVEGQAGGRGRAASPPKPPRGGTGCPTSGSRSRTSSTSPATRATSPSASTRTASPASCS